MNSLGIILKINIFSILRIIILILLLGNSIVNNFPQIYCGEKQNRRILDFDSNFPNSGQYCTNISNTDNCPSDYPYNYQNSCLRKCEYTKDSYNFYVLINFKKYIFNIP